MHPRQNPGYAYVVQKDRNHLTSADGSGDVHLDTFDEACEQDDHEHECRKAHERQYDRSMPSTRKFCN